jgi:drug/metabolite transporter (DMT)-like permease
MPEQQSQLIPILLNLLAALIGALGQYLYKLGGLRLQLVPLWKNWQLFLGMALFCAVMLLFVLAFKAGGRLSVTYPVYATTFIWGFLIAVLVDKEPWHQMQLGGIAVIMLGVILVAVGGTKI